MQYNVSTAKVVVATFFAFCCAGKVCTDSFLTVFLRRMGFSPFQAGILRCVQSFVGGASVITISYCARFYQKRISWAVFIFLAILSYLLLLITSLQYPCFYTPHPSCSSSAVSPNTFPSPFVTAKEHFTSDVVGINQFSKKPFTSSIHSMETSPPVFQSEKLTKKQVTKQPKTTFVSEKRANRPSGANARTEPSLPFVNQKDVFRQSGRGKNDPNWIPQVEHRDATLPKNSAEISINDDNFPLLRFEATVDSLPKRSTTTHKLAKSAAMKIKGEANNLGLPSEEHRDASNNGVMMSHEEKSSRHNATLQLDKSSQLGRWNNPKKKIWRNVPRGSSLDVQNSNATYWFRPGYRYPQHRDYDLQHTGRINPNPFSPSYYRQKRSNYAELVTGNSNNQTSDPEKKSNVDVSDDIASEWHHNSTVQSLLWPPLNLACLFVVIGLMCVGEFASSPIDKVADESWYQYLDEIDYIERYDQRMSGVTITTSLTLLGIVLIVKMYCSTEFLVLPAYHLHIYVFVLFWAVILFLGYFFPSSMSSSTQSGSLCKGMTFIGYMCRNSSSAVLLITVIVCGSLQGCINDFLLWYLEDLGASELITTSAVAVAVGSEILPWIFSRIMHVFRQPSLSFLLCISIFVYTARLALMAVLTNMWAIVGTQVLHCFSSYFFWVAIQGYVTRLCFQGTSQSVMVILNIIYHYLGRALGSGFGGLVYSLSKPQMLFWCMAGISLLWGLFFFMLQYCSFSFRRPSGKFSRAFQKDYGDDDPQNTSLLGDEDEEDWLETAIKVDKQKRAKQSN